MSDNLNLEDLVIAKMLGFPPWPGMIVRPPSFMPNKPAPKNGRESYCIYFFGTRNFSWCDIVKPYVKGRRIDIKKPTKSLLSAYKEIDKFIAKADDDEWRSAFLAQIQPDQLSEEDSDVEILEAKPVKEVTMTPKSLAVEKTKHLSDVKLPARVKSASPSRAGPSTEAEELATPKVFKIHKQSKHGDKKKSETPLSGSKEKKEISKPKPERVTPDVKGPKLSKGDKKILETPVSDKTAKIQKLLKKLNEVIVEESSTSKIVKQPKESKSADKKILELPLSDPTEKMEKLDKKHKKAKVEESLTSKIDKQPRESKSSDKNKLETPKSGPKEKNKKSEQKPKEQKASTSRQVDDAAEEDSNSGTKRNQIMQTLALLDPTISPKELSPSLEVLTPTETLKKKNITPIDARIGFIGLGFMGCGIVKNILNSGHKVFIWNRTPDKADVFIEAGATYLPTPHDVVEAADVTFSCVSDIDAATKVVYGNCGVLNAITSRKSFIEMTAITPEYSEKLGKEITDRGGRYLECAMEGGKKESEQGELYLSCAGDMNLYDEVKPCLDSFSIFQSYLGNKRGEASFWHTVNQICFATQMSQIVENFNTTTKLGFGEEETLELVECVSPSPVLSMKKENLINKTFPTNHVVKHVKNEFEKFIIFAGEHPRINLTSVDIVNDKLRQLMRSGHADDDVSTLYFTF